MRTDGGDDDNYHDIGDDDEDDEDAKKSMYSRQGTSEFRGLISFPV